MNSSGVACSSNTSPPNQRKYEVFISFRGSDTRTAFTSHLYDALQRKNISAFIVGELKRGDPISTLFPIIEKSKVSVVIFSQNYASSTWCLEELVKMLDCKKTSGQIVIPVFYEVSLSDVKNQTNSYAESFAEHHQKQKPETILKWINALREASHLAGWHTSVTKPDSFLIEEIVKDIWKKLKHKYPVDNKSSIGSDSKPGEVVQQESIYNPLKRSRLWHSGYIYQVFRRNKDTKGIESRPYDGKYLKESALKSPNFYDGEAIVNKVHVSQWLEMLRYLHLDEFALKSLHPDSNFAEAIAKLPTTQNVFSTPETINRWRAPDLTSLAPLSVDEICKDVSSCNKGLVGIDSKIKEIESLLCSGSNSVCIVGIWGIGGIGKTTLARVTFNKIFTKFEDAYFMENIRKQSEKDPQLLALRQQLFSAIVEEENVKLCAYNGRLSQTKARLFRKKLLIVFDDMTHPKQMEYVIGPLDNWSSTGSKFIVTTRDKQVLQHFCKEEKIYKLHELSDNEALQLFSQYAFKQEDPHVEYEDLSQLIVKYAKGVPLAIKLLGAALHGKNKHVWERAMRNPNRIFSKDIKELLGSNYDGQGGDMKFGLLRGEKIGHGLEEFSNLEKLVKSDIDLDCQGCPLESSQSDAQSNLQENPLVHHDMPVSSIEKHRKNDSIEKHRKDDDQKQTIPKLVVYSKPPSHLETTGKEATKQTGLLKWLGSKFSLSSQFDSSATEELHDTIKSQQQIIEQQQLQLTSTEEQLAHALQRIEEQARMILDISSRCQRMEDFLGHVRNGPPPSPPSIGRGSAMTC